MKRFALIFCFLASLTACNKDKRPTVVLLGDSITWGEEPVCEHDRYDTPITHYAKKLAKKLVGKGCSAEFDITKALPQYNFIVMGYHDARADQLFKDTRARPKQMHGENHVAEAIALKPDMVVVLAGTNDMKQKMPPEFTAERVRAIRKAFNDAGIRVAVATVPIGTGFDRQALDNLNKGLGAEIDYYSVTQVNGEQKQGLFNDGIHPNAAGYEVMLPELKRALEKALR